MFFIGLNFELNLLMYTCISNETAKQPICTILNYDNNETRYVLVVFGFLSLEVGFLSFRVALGVTDLSAAIVSIATNLNAIRGVSCAT